MANITLYLDDVANRMTLRAMLEAEGHRIVEVDADLAITDDPAQVAALAAQRPVLVLASAGRIPEAVRAMGQGAFGYVFLPLQPLEAQLMVRRALEWAHGAGGNRDAEAARATLEEVEFQHIRATLRRYRNNQARAARALGIGRNTLWRKLKKMEQAERRTEEAGVDG